MADRKISDLTALTTPAAGDYLPIIDISESLAANKNKRITVEELLRGAPDGTAAAPSFAFESDGGNGFYLAGTDTIGVSTNGANRLTLSTSALTSTVPISGTAFIPTSSTVPANGIYLPAANTVGVATNGAQRIEIQADGDVSIDSGTVFVDAGSNRLGVNTSNPAYELEVSSTGEADIQIDSGSGQDGALRFAENGTNAFAIFHDASASALAVYDNTALSQRLTIDSSGNVGVGTSSPTDKLSVIGGDISVGEGGKLVCSAGTQSYYLLSSGSSEIGYQGTLNFRAFNAGSPKSALYLSSAGNVGIGTTSPSSALAVNNAADDVWSAASTDGLAFNASAGGVSTITTYLDNSSIRIGSGVSQKTGILITGQSSGSGSTIQLRTGNSERARIDSSGRLLVGTSTARSTFLGATYTSALQVETASSNNPNGLSIGANTNDDNPANLYLFKTRGTSVGANTAVQNGDVLGNISFIGANGTDLSNTAAWIRCIVDGTPFSSGDTTDLPGALVFSVTADGASSPTERMRLRNNGELWIHSSGGDPQFLITSSVAAGTSTRLISGRYSGGSIGTGTESFRVYTNGDVQNTNNSYGPISSDRRLKQDITDASSQWDDIKNIRITNFHYKNDPAGPLHLGPIAQELEQVSPGLIIRRPVSEDEIADPTNDLTGGDEVLSFKASILYMKAVKALQEAMERIEVLEQRLNDAGIN